MHANRFSDRRSEACFITHPPPARSPASVFRCFGLISIVSSRLRSFSNQISYDRSQIRDSPRPGRRDWPRLGFSYVNLGRHSILPFRYFPTACQSCPSQSFCDTPICWTSPRAVFALSFLFVLSYMYCTSQSTFQPWIRMSKVYLFKWSDIVYDQLSAHIKPSPGGEEEEDIKKKLTGPHSPIVLSSSPSRFTQRVDVISQPPNNLRKKIK